MAFQTSIFRDGEWVTETVDIHAALKASAATKPTLNTPSEPPVCGILSQTLVESPIVHWVLPVRLRSRDHNDIAFVGSHFVQIKELHQDGQVHDVLRINNLGARIRNAIVVGDPPEYGPDDDGMGNTGFSNRRFAGHQIAPDSDDSFDARPVPSSLPPQRLVCMLETGQLVFLFIEKLPNASLQFSVSKYRMPAKLVYLGYHFVVDPSSRYIATADPDGVLVVLELERLAILNGQYVRGEPLRHVRSFRVRAMWAAIQKVAFLFPRIEDDFHIILVLIVVRKEEDRGSATTTMVSRLITFEWEVGDELWIVFAGEKRGHRLPPMYQMPILLIPIRFKTAFFTISAYSIGVVRYALTGSLEFDSLPLEPWPPTKLHHGNHEPLWTAWARPFRTRKYFEKTDVVYLAREDGAVIHLEIDATEMIPSVTSGWSLQTNIDTAFTTAYDIFSDVLVIGGDSGPGGIWKLAARSEPEQVNSLPNWAPVVDIVATTGELARGAIPAPSAAEQTMHRAGPRGLPMYLRKSDDIFSASGRGSRGNITQWRWGIEARIGLDIELGEPIRQAWVFTVDAGQGSFLVSLLASPTSSSLLEFRQDLGDVREVPPDKAPFDLASRTLHATKVSETIIQVTETSITVVTPVSSSRCAHEKSLDSAGIVAEKAFCVDNIVLLSTHTGEGSRLHVVRAEVIQCSLVSTWQVEGEITCLSAFKTAIDCLILVASMDDRGPWITIYSMSGTITMRRQMSTPPGAGERRVEGEEENEEEAALFSTSRLEAITSIVIYYHGSQETATLLLGSRCGRLITMILSKDSHNVVQHHQERIGVARVDVFPTCGRFKDSSTILVCCEENLILMTNLNPDTGQFNRRHYVWPVDLNDTSLPRPAVHSVFHIPHALIGDAHEMSLMILSGSRLLIADAGEKEGHVPRTMPLAGTPTRVIYSEKLRCLVVALLSNDRPTLAFIDPRTGTDVSIPGDRYKTLRPFISGLGTPGDKIFGLGEWQFVKDGRTFVFILVTTRSGKIIIVSTETGSTWGSEKRILYWTRYKKELDKPIYSIVGDAEGLLYCVDKTIHYDVLDLAAKKLRNVRSFEIESSALSMQIVEGRLVVLTCLHSLMIFQHPKNASVEPVLIHSDRISRAACHMIDIGVPKDVPSRWPMTLVSDQSRGISGFWVPRGPQTKQLELVFEAKLPFSIRRFAQARRRAPWQTRGKESLYGVIPTSPDGAELIGVGLCGSMSRFRLLSPQLWRLLHLIQTLTLSSGLASPFARRDGGEGQAVPQGVRDESSRPDPGQMHIDGDLLSKCLEGEFLARVLEAGDSMILFCRYVDAVAGPAATEQIRNMNAFAQGLAFLPYVRLGQEILSCVLDKAGFD